MKRQQEGYAYSLYLAQFYEKIKKGRISAYNVEFPGGLPSVLEENYFRLEDGIDWLNQNLDTIPNPFLGYFHYLPPHFPYKTHFEFKNRFVNDGWEQIVKPQAPPPDPAAQRVPD